MSINITIGNCPQPPLKSSMDGRNGAGTSAQGDKGGAVPGERLSDPAAQLATLDLQLRRMKEIKDIIAKKIAQVDSLHTKKKRCHEALKAQPYVCFGRNGGPQRYEASKAYEGASKAYDAASKAYEKAKKRITVLRELIQKMEYDHAAIQDERERGNSLHLHAQSVGRVGGVPRAEQGKAIEDTIRRFRQECEGHVEWTLDVARVCFAADLTKVARLVAELEDCNRRVDRTNKKRKVYEDQQQRKWKVTNFLRKKAGINKLVDLEQINLILDSYHNWARKWETAVVKHSQELSKRSLVKKELESARYLVNIKAKTVLFRQRSAKQHVMALKDELTWEGTSLPEALKISGLTCKCEVPDCDLTYGPSGL